MPALKYADYHRMRTEALQKGNLDEAAAINRIMNTSFNWFDRQPKFIQGCVVAVVSLYFLAGAVAPLFWKV